MILIGTNTDKRQSVVEEDIVAYANEKNMTYIKANCSKIDECEKIMDDAIKRICFNIDSNSMPWDSNKPPKEGWSRFGIMVIGDRNIIDSGIVAPKPDDLEMQDVNKIDE